MKLQQVQERARRSAERIYQTLPLETQDYTVQEKLIAGGVNSVKAGLPKSGHVDVKYMVQQTLQAFKQSLSHR